MINQRVQTRPQWSKTFVQKSFLAVATLVLMASMGGGFLLLPLLVPLHVWAGKSSGHVGRVLWAFGPVISAVMVSWAAVYVTLGEPQPAIWAIPVLAAISGSLAWGWAMRVTSQPLAYRTANGE